MRKMLYTLVLAAAFMWAIPVLAQMVLTCCSNSPTCKTSSNQPSPVQAETGTCTAGTGSTTTSCTVGFQYKAAILWSDMKTATGESNGAGFVMGFSDGTRFVNDAWSGDNAVATSSTGGASSGDTDNRAAFFLTNGTPTIATGGRLTSVAFTNATTMTLTFDANPSSAWKINYIGFGGSVITNVYVGHGVSGASTGSVSVTAPAFQGNAVFIITNGSQAQSIQSNSEISLGFAQSSTKRWAVGGSAQSGQTTGAAIHGQSIVTASAVIKLPNYNAATDGLVADFTQFTANGFDLNFSTVGAAYPSTTFQYLLIKGGSWDCGTSAKPTTATTQTVSGSSVNPTIAGFAMSSATALDTYTTNEMSEFGAYDGTHNASAGAYHNSAINTVAKADLETASALHEMNATANMSGTSLNADGWTGTWSATGTAFQVAWWAVH